MYTSIYPKLGVQFIIYFLNKYTEYNNIMYLYDTFFLIIKNNII